MAKKKIASKKATPKKKSPARKKINKRKAKQHVYFFGGNKADGGRIPKSTPRRQGSELV